MLLQTFLPDNEVVRAALLADPGRLVAPETERRRLLTLPPFAALAAISGRGAEEFVESLRADPDVLVGRGPGDVNLARAPTWADLGRALIATPRPAGSRLRIEVDPPRR